MRIVLHNFDFNREYNSSAALCFDPFTCSRELNYEMQIETFLYLSFFDINYHFLSILLRFVVVVALVNLSN